MFTKLADDTAHLRAYGIVKDDLILCFSTVYKLPVYDPETAYDNEQTRRMENLMYK